MVERDTQELWQNTLELLHNETEEHSYLTWFKPLKLVSGDGGVLKLEVGDNFVRQVLRTRFQLLIHNAVLVTFGQEYDIQFATTEELAAVKPQPSPFESNLNPKYTFDTFVVGASNRFAHAAALAVAQMPSDAYNPLFLYGGAGLGKTHLIHAIGHYIMQNDPSKRFLYITSESFTNQLITAISKKTNQELRDRLRTVDVLMVDDIQFIAGKTATQEEFFHTFNELHGNGKQIIISSDRPPKDIPTLEERLRSRFEWGLIADISKPDYETRIAILRRKAETENIAIDDSVLHMIAEKIESNVRELEGALTHINAMAEIEHSPITHAMAEAALGKILQVREEKRVSAELIMNCVAQFYGVSQDDMLSGKRNREIAMPRQIAMYLTREMTTLSTTRIGEAFGGRDHTTVMHGCDKISELVKTDASLRETIGKLRENVQA